jgi:hypothetical protein
MKNFIFTILCCISYFVGNAQDKQTTSFGVTLNGVLSNLSFPNGALTGASESKIGFSGGAYFSIPVTDIFSIRPECNYAMIGGKNTANAFSVNLNYLTIPVLASFKLDKSGFSVYVGPQYGLLLSASQVDHGNKTDIKSLLSGSDIAAVGGIQYMPQSLGIGLRYQLGLSNDVADKNSGYSLKNNAIYLSALIKF